MMSPAALSILLKRGDRGPAVVAVKRDLKAWFDANAPGEWAQLGIADGGHFGAALEKGRHDLPGPQRARSEREGRRAHARQARGRARNAVVLAEHPQAGPYRAGRQEAEARPEGLVPGQLAGEWAGFGVADGDHFGAALEQAVKVFQARNDLAVDGKVGRETREALAAAVPA